MKIDEDDEIVSFSIEETNALDEYFKGTNAETAYLLGRYCGLRINECYGLNGKFQKISIYLKYLCQAAGHFFNSDKPIRQKIPHAI